MIVKSVLTAMLLIATVRPVMAETIYVDAGAERTTSSDVMTWAEYWDEHPLQQKVTKPVRAVWHHGPEQVWKVTGLPTFKTFCAFGKWSHQSGLTQAVGAVGAAGSIATPFVAGFKK